MNHEPLSDADFNALQERVAELDETHNVIARSDYETYFDFGYALLYRKDLSAAEQSYLKGLRLYAWGFDAQIRVAEMEIRAGKVDQAYQRLQFVISADADEQPKRYATYLITHNNLEQTARAPRLPDRWQYKLLVVPIGNVNDAFISAVRSRLTQEFHITVESKPPVPFPSQVKSRETFLEYLDQAIADFEAGNSGKVVGSFYARIGIGAQGPSTSEEKEQVVRELIYLQKGGDAIWEEVKWLFGTQFEAEGLLEHLEEITASERRDQHTLGALGITDVDIYSEGLNYLFATSELGAGIMSYHRFYGPNDSADVGLHRTIVQAMTSYVLILGVERASTLPCATAYPHSLWEFDQKTDILCAEEVNRLIVKYSQLGP